MKESKLQTAILKKLKPYYHIKIISASTAGHPDIVMCKEGRAIFIECKSDTGKLSALQEYQRDEIIKSGGIYILARSVEDVDRILCSK